MAYIALAERARPALVAASLLAAFAAVPWHECERDAHRARTVTALDLAVRPEPIERANPFVIEPAPHPDAQPWPRGMVMTPPETNDPIAIGTSPGPLVSLLSGLLALAGMPASPGSQTLL